MVGLKASLLVGDPGQRSYVQRVGIALASEVW